MIHVTAPVADRFCVILANVTDSDGSGDGAGGGIHHNAGADVSVPSTRVCFNDPDDIVAFT